MSLANRPVTDFPNIPNHNGAARDPFDVIFGSAPPEIGRLLSVSTSANITRPLVRMGALRYVGAGIASFFCLFLALVAWSLLGVVGLLGGVVVAVATGWGVARLLARPVERCGFVGSDGMALYSRWVGRERSRVLSWADVVDCKVETAIVKVNGVTIGTRHTYTFVTRTGRWTLHPVVNRRVSLDHAGHLLHFCERGRQEWTRAVGARLTRSAA